MSRIARMWTPIPSMAARAYFSGSEARRDDEAAREVTAEVLARELGKGLVRALHDALRADVRPRAGRHLAVHDEALGLELAELLPIRPLGHEVRVRDEDARRALVRLEDGDGLPALHEHRLVVLEAAER